jgi:hypothetical protein
MMGSEKQRGREAGVQVEELRKAKEWGGEAMKRGS